VGVALAAAIAAGCATARPPAPPAAPGSSRAATVTIVHLNDVYQISPVDGGKRGGLARVATLVKEVEGQSPHTIFMLAGDFLAPSVLSTRHKGAQMVDVLGAAGLDVATIGNHEFDFGVEVLRERIKGSPFAWTTANVLDGAGKPVAGALPDLIVEKGGVRVGIFGLLLAETAALARAGDLSFLDPIGTGRAQARRLRAAGADVVVALTHQTMIADQRLALEADVDVVIGGHDHEQMSSLAGGRLVLKLDADARQLGVVDLRLQRDRDDRWQVVTADFRAIPVTDKVKEDPAVAALVKRYEDELGATLGEVIGSTDVALDARADTNRTTETALGNFIADSWREALETDVAIVNSGSLRSDTSYPPGSLTRRDVLSILPFDNTLMKVRVTGAQLRRLLENGVGLVEFGEGRFPQVSGVRLRFDPARPAGSRIVELEVGGKPVEAAARYTLAVSSYVHAGGDGYDFTGTELMDRDGPLDSLVVIEAIRRLGRIAPREEGRIRTTAPTLG
jgi:2',3'-cyclic-nucleotide 2'-phosphodiesterase (5'-nucleotidase family)